MRYEQAIRYPHFRAHPPARLLITNTKHPLGHLRSTRSSLCPNMTSILLRPWPFDTSPPRQKLMISGWSAAMIGKREVLANPPPRNRILSVHPIAIYYIPSPLITEMTNLPSGRASLVHSLTHSFNHSFIPITLLNSDWQNPNTHTTVCFSNNNTWSRPDGTPLLWVPFWKATLQYVHKKVIHNLSHWRGPTQSSIGST